MDMALKRTLAAMVWCLLALTPMVFAQESGNVAVSTDPPGSLVRLAGDLTLSGITPVQFDRTLSGRYRLEVNRDGYERYHTVAYFSEGKAVQLSIKLVPKTRVKALFRSAIFPGWGQKYYGDKVKAALFTVGTAASAIGYFFVKDDYDSKVDDYHAKKEAFEAATRWEDVVRLEGELREAQRKANGAENRVNVMVVLTAGVYVLNILDSFMFFPDFTQYTEYKSITARPDIRGDQVGVNLSMRF